MDTLPRSGATARFGCLLVVILIMLPLLYAISVGHAVQIAFRLSARPGPDNERPLELFETIYGPLIRFAHSTGTEGILQNYVDLWDRLIGPRRVEAVQATPAASISSSRRLHENGLGERP